MRTEVIGMCKTLHPVFTQGLIKPKMTDGPWAASERAAVALFGHCFQNEAQHQVPLSPALGTVRWLGWRWALSCNTHRGAGMTRGKPHKAVRGLVLHCTTNISEMQTHIQDKTSACFFQASPQEAAQPYTGNFASKKDKGNVKVIK